MTVSLRLGEPLETELRRRLAQDGTSLSDFIRQAVREKIERKAQSVDPYALGPPLFGRHARGEQDRSQRRKQIIHEQLDAKHRR